jgi:polyphosphate kinase
MSGKRDYINKEISWLSFNERVLQEAMDLRVPLPQRIKFLGIYSNNLDEFFRVRVATLKRLTQLGKKSMELIEEDPAGILESIQKIVIEQHGRFEKVFNTTKKELEDHGIYFLREHELNEHQQAFVYDYLIQEIRPKIFPVMIDGRYRFPELKDTALYLAVELIKSGTKGSPKFSIIEIPSKTCSRFILLPGEDKKQYIILLEDVIRYGLPYIFGMLDYDCFQAFDIKITRDSELDIDDDFGVSYLNKIQKSLDKRKRGRPVRLTYDTEMPQTMVDFFKKKLKLKPLDTLLPGGRYHNSRDYISFPKIIREDPDQEPPKIPHKDLEEQTKILDVIRKKDVLLQFPYHPFDYLIDLLREAALDPKVTGIKITLYRVARYSSVVNALINARKNRKEVVVLLELQARFDEKANINWANKLKKEGVKVIFGIPGLKVHAKLCSITKKKTGDEVYRIAAIGTGNFNEDTAQSYTDSYLLTGDERITEEVERLFDFFESNYKIVKFKTLLVSPFYFRDNFNRLVDEEIAHAAAGKEAYIHMKLNNIADKRIGKKLYEAGRAGVKVRLIIRGMFSLVAGKEGLSENIEAISIVDRYLEHTRYYIFAAGGEEKVFISSADLLPRNLDRRVEVTCPIFEEKLKKELIELFDTEWKDNCKARILDENLKNRYRKTEEKECSRAQVEKGKYISREHTGGDGDYGAWWPTA